MLYSILIYAAEAELDQLDQKAEEAILARHGVLQSHMRASGGLGPFARLMSTSAAVTIKPGEGKPLVIDGPFAETKEQLLGLYLIECDNLDEAVAAASLLPTDIGSIEIRPIRYFGTGDLAGAKAAEQSG
ncbi:YciI family protein [Oceanibacterium hippocampi]|uniref:YCII-related domain protein n=1 Tax=Oceanibacterium hippocampi TaxID=745714 RepID=A0A1Y5U319_9PROT|nr:YciI family protein [Oceanibacterium hippocampi]SLN75969.1 YCII-related domain protein [Oceanibacterium hippocampi]